VNKSTIWKEHSNFMDVDQFRLQLQIDKLSPEWTSRIDDICIEASGRGRWLRLWLRSGNCSRRRRRCCIRKCLFARQGEEQQRYPCPYRRLTTGCERALSPHRYSLWLGTLLRMHCNPVINSPIWYYISFFLR
jgi:hypothetical protein